MLNRPGKVLEFPPISEASAAIDEADTDDWESVYTGSEAASEMGSVFEASGGSLTKDAVIQ